VDGSRRGGGTIIAQRLLLLLYKCIQLLLLFRDGFFQPSSLRN
jgi:hypothetical protein